MLSSSHHSPSIRRVKLPIPVSNSKSTAAPTVTGLVCIVGSSLILHSAIGTPAASLLGCSCVLLGPSPSLSLLSSCSPAPCLL